MMEAAISQPGHSQPALVLSLFPGLDLFGKGFAAEGFCVVRGPDLWPWREDVRDFHPPRCVFTGIIGGSPCQDFSLARRNTPPTGEGVKLLREFLRVVYEAAPDWFLLENVPAVPDVAVEGYSVQRIRLNALECGGHQSRLRHFQFGSRHRLTLQPARCEPPAKPRPCVTASEHKRGNPRSFGEICRLQGLPGQFTIAGVSQTKRIELVGNGVPVYMARVMARAIRESVNRRDLTDAKLCPCGCGRRLTGKLQSATANCRKLKELAKKNPRQPINYP